jgi:hypothetical protein
MHSSRRMRTVLGREGHDAKGGFLQLDRAGEFVCRGPS